uniref:Globin family profile domain-containing protein n=1 Tax=Romanomermis culicivorax TaxID=13658 RepID=A0A915HQ04_ROMCU
MYRNGLMNKKIMINYGQTHSTLNGHCIVEGDDDEHEHFKAKLKEIVGQITPNEKNILRQTFEILNDDPVRRGACVYVNFKSWFLIFVICENEQEKLLQEPNQTSPLFQDYPEYKNLWPQLRCISDSLLFGHTLLDQLGAIYCNGLKEIVSSMDDDEKLCYQMEKIAHKHHIKRVTRVHLQNMLPKLIETLEMGSGKSVSDETSEAWKKLFNAVASIIELYHDKYLLEKRRDVQRRYSSNTGRAY